MTSKLQKKDSFKYYSNFNIPKKRIKGSWSGVQLAIKVDHTQKKKVNRVLKASL